ncbi:MAG: outer membrane protein [Halothiobacillaceae bacterium]|nr:MAG: outer membrane protein [Halothiobacillaceae bacterium]
MGDLFSRKLVTQSSENISQRFGLEGYAFSNINPVPNVNKESREVSLTFVVDPGKRIYVRRVNIAGNTRTRDDVVRRELRQFEGGWIATDKINRSRERLMRLGYFEEVNVETPSVPGVEDQVDVNITVKERSTGSVQAGVGFSESQGVLFTASISHDNFFGSGKRVSAEVNTSQVNTIYSFLYNNPYYTQEGISRGIRLFYRKTDSSATNTASYNADTYGLNVDYGFPLSEYYRTSLGFGLEHTEIRETSSTPQAYSDFLRDNAAVFDLLKINPGWSYDTRDRAIFPIKGVFNSIDGEVATPGSDLTYYKIATRAQWYHPLSKSWVFYLGGQVGYGGAYGDTTNLPFFENYYAGGVRTVRGFRSNTLGPREEDKPLGGAFKTVGNAELYFPVPFNPEAKTIRLGLFYDTGNVYEDTGDFDTNQFRSSVGISASWMSPIGPMIFGKTCALASGG